MPEKNLSFGNVSEQTGIHLKALNAQLGKGNFKNSRALIHILATDTPRRYAGIAAARLGSIGTQQELKFIRQESKGPAFVETITMLYSASGELYKLRGFFDKAEEMFKAADIFKARAKPGL